MHPVAPARLRVCICSVDYLDLNRNAFLDLCKPFRYSQPGREEKACGVHPTVSPWILIVKKLCYVGEAHLARPSTLPTRRLPLLRPQKRHTRTVTKHGERPGTTPSSESNLTNSHILWSRQPSSSPDQGTDTFLDSTSPPRSWRATPVPAAKSFLCLISRCRGTSCLSLRIQIQSQSQ